MRFFSIRESIELLEHKITKLEMNRDKEEAIWKKMTALEDKINLLISLLRVEKKD